MKLIIEKMFNDSQIPTKEHPRSSGYDLYVHRFIKWFSVTADPDDNTKNVEMSFELPNNQPMKELYLDVNQRVMIGTGIKAKLDYTSTDMTSFCFQHDLTWELQVRARSGTALKRGLMVANGIGTIDDGYTGEICVIITNSSGVEQTIEVGERIAQLVPTLVSLPKLVVVNDIGKSSDGRGEGGFNSTGTK